VIYQRRLAPLYSNAPYGGAQRCADALRSVAHTVVDLARTSSPWAGRTR